MCVTESVEEEEEEEEMGEVEVEEEEVVVEVDWMREWRDEKAEASVGVGSMNERQIW